MGAIKINSAQATDLDDFSNDTDIKCRITLWLMLLLTRYVSRSTRCTVLTVCIGFRAFRCCFLPLFPSLHVSPELKAHQANTLCDIVLFLDSFSARAHTFLYTPYTTCYRSVFIWIGYVRVCVCVCEWLCSVAVVYIYIYTVGLWESKRRACEFVPSCDDFFECSLHSLRIRWNSSVCRAVALLLLVSTVNTLDVIAVLMNW